jgi:4-hydroxyphenylacetate 3-monooxygenase
MTLMTGQQYRESLRDGRRVWIEGEFVENVTRHPAFAGMIDAMAKVYDMQHDDRFRDALTFESNGVRRGRFYKIPETRDDLVMRRHMTLAVLNEVSPVMDRFGDETVTPLFVMYDREDLLNKFDRRYHQNVVRWIDKLQQTNLFMTSGNTDMKGDRSRQPYEQQDPDHYLRVVEESEEGIVVSGAKYETGASYAHVAFVKPTVGTWIPENKDYAVAFIVPMNAHGLKHICRAPLVRDVDPFDRPLSARFDEIDTLLVFDHVLIPWENVMFSRHYELAQQLRADLVRWAAQGFLLRSFSKADIIVGTALLIAEQTRISAFPQVKERIAQLMMYRETLHSFVLAAEASAERTLSGLWMPNQAVQNAGRVFASSHYTDMVQLLRDVMGGSHVVVPGRRMMENKEIRGDIEKYFRIGNVSAEDRIRVLNLATELTTSAFAGRAQSYALFAESPIFAQAMALYETFDRKGASNRAARLASISVN